MGQDGGSSSKIQRIKHQQVPLDDSIVSNPIGHAYLELYTRENVQKPAETTYAIKLFYGIYAASPDDIDSRALPARGTCSSGFVLDQINLTDITISEARKKFRDLRRRMSRRGCRLVVTNSDNDAKLAPRYRLEKRL